MPKNAYEFLISMRYPALRLPVVCIQVERLCIWTVLARNLGEILLPGRDLDDGIDLLRALVRSGVFVAAAGEIEVVLRRRGRHEQRSKRQPENAHLGQIVSVRV